MECKIIGPAQEQTSASKVETYPPIMGMAREDFEKLASSILIMIPHRNTSGISAGLGQCIGLWSLNGTAVATIEDEFGGFVELTRAGMVRAFQEYREDRPEVRFCFMVDSDENIPWDAPYRLAAWDLPVVSGVVCSYHEQRGIFACFMKKDEYGVARFPSWNVTKTLPAKGLIEVHSAGTGMLCVRADVFDAMAAAGEVPFVIPEDKRRLCFESGVLKWGEDTSFCALCDKLGFKRYVDLSVRAIHYKTIAIQWPHSHLDWEIDPQSWKIDPRDYHHG